MRITRFVLCVTFRPYKRQIETILYLHVSKRKVIAIGRCIWGCEFDAVVSVSWLGTKLSDPNNVLKEWQETT